MHSGSYSTVREPEDGIVLPRGLFFIIACLLVILTILVVALPLAIYLNQDECHAVDSPYTTAPPTNSPLIDLKLPRNFLPSHYDLEVRVSLADDNEIATENNSNYNGTISIDVLCVEQTNIIYVNGDEGVTIDSNTVSVFHVLLSEATELVNLSKGIEFDKQTQVWQINTAESLTNGAQYRIIFNFRSVLSNRQDSFFRSSYKENGIIRHLAATQFKPQSARKAWPCFDEPDLKSTFSVKLIHPIKTTALSNGKEISTDIIDSAWKRTVFETTPRMSTYLLAFFISQYSFRTSTTERGLTFRVWAPSSHMEQTSLASRIGPVILDYYENWFNYAYPLSKLDMIAMKDFDAEGMENWGLVLIKDKFILQNDQNESVDHKKEIAQIIAHELAHQWFGNLVTMKSWDGLWLNEGFANYLQFSGSDRAVNGSLHMSTQFICTSMDRAMYLDSLNTHALHTDNQENYEYMLDDITYDKGASIIHMLENVVGLNALQMSLINYISLYKYNNADPDQLWAVFTQTVDNNNIRDWDGGILNVTNFMECWISRPGYPLVTVTRNYQTNTVTASAAVFSIIANYTQPANIACPDGWFIPIWYKQSKGTNMVWLKPKEIKTWTLNGNINQFIIVNPEAKGFYRVNYDEQNWKYLVDMLNNDHTKLNVNSRTQILNDAYMLAKSGVIDYGILLSMSKYLQAESEYAPWCIAAKYLFNDMSRLMSDSQSFQLYKKYLQEIIRPVYHRIDFIHSLNTSLLIEQQFLSLIYTGACELDEANCITLVKYYFNDLKLNCIDTTIGTSGDCNRVPANIRSAVYCNGIRMGDLRDWEWLWQRMLHEEMPSEKEIHFNALASFENSDTLRTKFCSYTTNNNNPDSLIVEMLLYANRLLSGSSIEESDVLMAMVILADKTSIGLNIIWEILINQFSIIFARFKELDTFAVLITTVIKQLNTDQQQQQAVQFIEDHRAAFGNSLVTKLEQECLENLKANVRWKDKYRSQVENWLENEIKTA